MCFQIRSLSGAVGHVCCLTCLWKSNMRWELSWMSHVLTAGGWPSQLWARLQYLKSTGVPTPLPKSNLPKVATSGSSLGDKRVTVRAAPSGNKPLGLLTPPVLRSQSSCLRSELGHLKGLHQSYSSRLTLMTRCRFAASDSAWGWRYDCSTPFGCDSVVRVRPRDDGYACLGCRECGIEWNLPPCPEPLRLDDWFLSSWKWMRNSLGLGWQLSPPSMLGWSRDTPITPLWNRQLQCNYSLTSPGGVNRTRQV